MFLEAYERIAKDLMKAISGKKEVVKQSEEIVPKSDENELCENQDNQGETIQLPCGE